ncbi:nicotinate mononucleotide-dependent phosphoribosyltransferase CobT [Calothrix sp. 336/3]|uniref:nicotinate mononucleotide-dependent phosphoribosyltransferase CobT n=1 Tax=Calothrix sp. 336/3 TaxID=1337936 RepID=UPI0004E45229|nr:TIGR00303 family protein [Calothrix sp. 336/3]AKG23591.1 hypothetical protein IJ00_21950 [Calothrix sp. 336/3]
MIQIYHQVSLGEAWLNRFQGTTPIFACVLGFTATALIPGISAAGLTPEDRKYTAIADAEFLYYGANHQPKYPLPPLTAGASPVLISRAVVEGCQIPLHIFNAGLPQAPNLPVIDLGGNPAECLTTAAAMPIATVEQLFTQGMLWGERLSQNIRNGYLVIGECVVGGTTTALGILTGLGIDAKDKVNSSHAECNHSQKWTVVQQGLAKIHHLNTTPNPLQLVAAVGDPMQVVVAGMAIAASRSCGVMLAGGTQMLAVYALASAIADFFHLPWQPTAIAIGTTRWVAADSRGNTAKLADSIGQYCLNLHISPPTLLATQLSFAQSQYPQLSAYEAGFVKEGMGAGGAAITASLSYGWQQEQLLIAIEAQMDKLAQISSR